MSALALIPDVDRIAAARWAARELLLGRLVSNSSTRWIHRVDAKGAIRSELQPIRARRR